MVRFFVRKPEDFETAFAAMAERQVDAVIVTGISLTYENRRRVAEVALRHRLPIMAAFSEFPRAGMLMSYGPNFPTMYRRAASYVDKVLKGTPPGDIPVEQPIKYDLVINLKTAKAIGVDI